MRKILATLFAKETWLLLIIVCTVACTKKTGTGGTVTPPPPPPPPTPEYSAQVNIIATENNQTIQGFGCATVFTPPSTTPLTTEEFDRLFGTANGQIGLNFLRIRIASDDAWRATELAHAKAAIQRGAKVFASPWSPPARMKTNNNIVKGKLIPDSANAYGKYLNDFALYMAANGAPLYAVSVQNEPDWEPDYEGCVWTATEMRDFLKNQGGLITATRLMAPELVNNNQNYINTILSDNGAVANLDIFATHIYGGGIVDNSQLRSLGKEIWMTEHLITDTTYGATLNTALEIHDCFTKANFSAYIWWYGKRFYGPIGQDGIVTKRGYFISQFARFIKEGAVRIGTSVNTRADVHISAYKNGTKKVVVAINKSNGIVNQTISFTGATATTITPYTTSTTKNAEQGANITVANNSFIYAIPPNSVITFVEQ
jgi:glucuronoarabinoxylan endo-1,4-beta-xylanase